jgi:predicted SpoU family rRNA methylase
LLALLAASDEIVPQESSMRLIEQWGGPHSVKIIEGSHNTLQDYSGYWESIGEFLAQL